MGSYSFYKIIKDIIRTLFGNKFTRYLLIILIIFIIFSLKNNISYGAYNQYDVSDNWDVTYNGTTYHIELPQSLKDLYFNDTTQIFGFYYSSYFHQFTFYGVVNHSDYVIRSWIDGNNHKVYAYSSINNFSSSSNEEIVYRFDYDYVNNTYSTTNSLDSLVESFPKTYPFLYATKNIYNRYDNGIVFAENGQKIKVPEIVTTLQDLETLNFDVLSINAWDYSNTDFDVLFYDLNYGSDTADSLYPVNVITLNKDTLYFNADLTADADVNAIYWIPIEEIGFNWQKGYKYGIKFAVRNYDIGSGPGTGNGSFGDASGGGFRGDDYIYNYLGDGITFTVSDTVQDSVISSLNSSTKDKKDQQNHDETMNKMDDINNALTNTTVDGSVSSDVENSLNFNNQNEGLNNLNNGFFSRLASMLSSLLGYNLTDVSTINIPLPHTNKVITLRSDLLYANMTDALKTLIFAFWTYLFTFYMFKFINKLYIAISTGNILDTFSSNDEVITNSML